MIAGHSIRVLRFPGFRVFSMVTVMAALLVYSQSMPKEVRGCSIHSAIDSEGFTDFVQTCRTYIVIE